MLRELHIKDFILIENLSLYFEPGFSVFTGETGAGKSILLGGLALVLGERANFSNIRKNKSFAEVVAIFDCNNDALNQILKENFIDIQDTLVIRRVITLDSKSRSFINDTPVSVTLLKNIGDLLVDVHGQFDNHKLLNPAYHCTILDNFLPSSSILEEVNKAYISYTSSYNLYKQTLEESKKSQLDKEYIEFSLQELEELNVKEGEEKELSEHKISINNSKKIQATLDKIANNLINTNTLSSLNKLLKILESSRDTLNNHKMLNDIISKIENAYSTIVDAEEYFNALSLDFYVGDLNLDHIDERLMNIRMLANKHRVLPDDLPKLKQDFQKKLETIKNSSDTIDALYNKMQKNKKYFYEIANHLSDLRKNTAKDLNDKVRNELKYLKLSQADFLVDIETDNEKISPLGIDKVIFKVKTNIGSNFGLLNKIASGGEMARIMLAIKIVLAEIGIIPTIILDEIDIGVGGDVADSIGSRLKYLSQNIQTIVITHSHQVASKGKFHFKVVKESDTNITETKVRLLNDEERVLEIARMLSGSVITEETKKAALVLLISSK